jgi:hypothetical protein
MLCKRKYSTYFVIMNQGFIVDTYMLAKEKSISYHVNRWIPAKSIFTTLMNY